MWFPFMWETWVGPVWCSTGLIREMQPQPGNQREGCHPTVGKKYDRCWKRCSLKKPSSLPREHGHLPSYWSRRKMALPGFVLSLPSRQHRQQPHVSIPYVLQLTLHPRCGCQWGLTRGSSFHGQEWKFDKDRMPILCNTQRDVGISLGGTTLSTILVWAEVQSKD